MTRPEVVIRAAVPADAAALTDLHLDCWDDAYTGLIPQAILDERRTTVPQRVAFWRAALAQGAPIQLAEVGGRLVGFSGATRTPGAAPELELKVLYVRAPLWGTGLGHTLLAAAVGDEPAYLWVLDGNERAIGFYERHGFRRDGVAEDEPEGRHLRMVRG